MAIAKRPKGNLSAVAKPDPMEFIQGADTRKEDPASQSAAPARKRKEPVIIRFDDETLTRVDKAAAKRGLSRSALVRMLVIENLPD
jgi:predicted DNA binding CopG/RHH family protein